MKNKYTKEEFQNAVLNSKSIAQVCKKLNLKPQGGNYQTIHKNLKEWNIDTSHFTGQGWNVGLKFIPKQAKPLNELLVYGDFTQSYKLKNKLLKANLKKQQCEICKRKTWLKKPISLELHHIDGDKLNNQIDNLQLICPNCHQQTNNYRSKNMGRLNGNV